MYIIKKVDGKIVKINEISVLKRTQEVIKLHLHKNPLDTDLNECYVDLSKLINVKENKKPRNIDPNHITLNSQFLYVSKKCVKVLELKDESSLLVKVKGTNLIVEQSKKGQFFLQAKGNDTLISYMYRNIAELIECGAKVGTYNYFKTVGKKHYFKYEEQQTDSNREDN